MYFCYSLSATPSSHFCVKKKICGWKEQWQPHNSTRKTLTWRLTSLQQTTTDWSILAHLHCQIKRVFVQQARISTSHLLLTAKSPWLTCCSQSNQPLAEAKHWHATPNTFSTNVECWEKPWHDVEQSNLPLHLLHCTGQPQATMEEELRKEDELVEMEEPEHPANWKAPDPHSGSKLTP